MKFFSVHNFKVSPLLHLVVPFTLCLLLTLASFNWPSGVANDLGPLVLPLFILFIFEIVRLSRAKTSLPLPTLADLDATAWARALTLCFGWTVIAFCAADFYFHGFTLFDLNPSAYWQLNPMQTQIRHVSLMCWALAPFAFLKRLHWSNRLMFIATALLFPILVIDRNRMLSTFAALATMYFLFPELSKTIWRQTLKIICLLIIGASLFSIVGAHRSSDHSLNTMITEDRVHREVELRAQSHGAELDHLQLCERPQHLPLKPWFLAQSVRAKWILTYMTSSIFNFQTIAHCNWREPSYLKAQLIPGWLKTHASPPLLPFVFPDLNVGTEFLPFYLAAGPWGALIAFSLMYVLMLASAAIFRRQPSVFHLLIFLRLAYCSFTASFAPQFFIWTTLGFIILNGVLSFIQSWAEKNSSQILRQIPGNRFANPPGKRLSR